MSKKENEPVTRVRQTLGEYLRSLRDAARLKLREVEEASGVSNAYLSQLETGKINKPSPHILHKLAAVYGVPYEGLMERAGYISHAVLPGGDTQPVLPGSRIPAAALRDLTPEEEDALLNYLDYLRFKRTTG
jgi:transcriptional regulator with XRE-family HTH domain